MIVNEIEEVKRPIIYISLSLVVSSLCYGIYSSNFWLAVVSASLFFIYVISDTNIYFGIIVAIFFTIQLLINHNYYNFTIEDKVQGEINIVDKKDYYTIGAYKGRKFYLEEVDIPINLEDKIYFKGEFIKETDKEKVLLEQ